MRPRRLPTGEGNPLQIYIAMVEIQPIRVELDREEDGRVPASAPDLPGVMAYGVREEEAVRAVKSIALQVLADMIESGEEVFEPLKVLLAA
jgi:predicted RNase H-like HicB family nuclease